jgi:hypothetical protein
MMTYFADFCLLPLACSARNKSVNVNPPTDNAPTLSMSRRVIPSHNVFFDPKKFSMVGTRQAGG